MLEGIVIAAVLAVLAMWGIAIYNRLVRLRALVKEGFSGITVQLRRRADLVPNLVSTVEGYAAHEKGVLSEITAHRADATSATGVAATAQADNAFSAMLGRLIAVAEAYPDLKADDNFRQLQDELSEIEEQLQNGGTFGWYSGSGNVWSNPARFAGTVGASLASSVASASTAPGSSSGSGGGGSSGGGGGGGGW